MILTNENYFSREANLEYWSVSQFKSFDRCEACGLAEAYGLYEREKTDALLIGSYVDAVFSGELDQFRAEYGSQMFKKDGELLAKFVQANKMVSRIKSDSLMMEYLEGDKQKIMTAELFGVPWKVKIDVFNDERIVDLKAVKDFGDVKDPGYGYRQWVDFWGYDIQGAVYQKVTEIVTGKRLPFYLAAVTKEKVPDIKVLQIQQHILDAALKMVEAKIERFDLIKTGLVEPIRCERCDWCKTTKVLKAPEIYEVREAS